MTRVSFPYGKGSAEYDFGDELLAVLRPAGDSDAPPGAQSEIVAEAMAHPIGSPRLSELARGAKRVTLIASDHTRPVPSKLIVPPMLAEIRSASPDAEITILVATGCHRGTTREEIAAKFGEDIVAAERIVIHDCDDREHLRSVGTLPSGSICEIDTRALDCDLLVSEGFIEPHFFAGFSGGRKSVLPGVASRATVLANHCAEFIAHPAARTGSLEGNPLHLDMLAAAEKCRLRYIVNVVLDDEKRVIAAFAGDVRAAHKAGTDYLAKRREVRAVPADIVVTSNGGYPLDQNVYQACKGKTAAEACVKPGGVIVMLAECADGLGSQAYFDQLAEDKTNARLAADILARGRDETVPDQWQTQILLRVLEKARVIFVSSLAPDVVRRMRMIPAASLDEAMRLARVLVGTPRPTVTAIPDGVSVIVR